MKKRNILNKSKLIFNEEDIYKASNLLVRLIRKIFVANKITYNSFDNKIDEYYRLKRNASNLSVSIMRHNLLNPVLEDSLTFKGMNKIINILFNSTITSIEINILEEGSNVENSYKVKL